MGGLAIFIAIAVPFLILSDYRVGQPGGARHGARHGRARVRGRHIKLRRRRSLGVSGKTKLLVQAIVAIGLWIVVKEKVGLNARSSSGWSTPTSSSGSPTRC